MQATGRPSRIRTAIQNSDINVTPFVDIMLVLLIIFMVSAPLATVSLRLDLPPPTPGTPLKLEDPLYVTVSASGSIFVRDQPSTLAALPNTVCTAVGGYDCHAQRIFIRGEAETTYRDFMAVMNSLQGNGFFKVGLLNEDIT